MKADYHMHTHFSPDSVAKPEAMIERAIQLGMKTICITDHYDVTKVDGKIECNLKEEAYFQTITKLQEAYKNKIDLKLGVEISMDIRYPDQFKSLANKYPFDFIIGSNHKTPGSDDEWSADKPSTYTDKEWYTDAMMQTIDMVKTIDDFDVLGHFDYIVRYGEFKTRDYIVKDYTDVMEEVFKTLIYKGKGIEINASGFKYGLGFAHPHVDVLKLYKELGGEIITVGSDAHAPEHLGYNYEGVKQQLLQANFKYYTEFSDRKAIFHKLV